MRPRRHRKTDPESGGPSRPFAAIGRASRRGMPALLGSRQHGRADIDPDHRGARWIKRKIPSGADARVQDATREPLKEHRPDPAIAGVLEREVDEVVKRGNPLIAIKIRA